jgi:type II secretory pathway component PulC
MTNSIAVAAILSLAGVVNEGQHVYTVSQALVDHAMTHPEQVARSVGMAPEMRDGRCMGLRLTVVHPMTMFAGLGLQTGDVLRSMNGRLIQDPWTARQAYAQLKGPVRHVALEVEREGHTIVFDYWMR